ncbi:MAG: ATP-binding protein [Syntrophobacterales bacterium]|nr:ATP-binding protein [Syntrophobacterales bacterium]
MKFSLRLYLVILMFLIAVPLIAINFFSIVQLAEAEKNRAEGILLSILDEAEKNLDNLVRNSMDILSQIIQRNASPETLIKPFKSRYSSVGIVDERGLLIESSPPSSNQIDVSDRAWFRRVSSSRGTVIGHYLIERITGKPGLIVAKSIDSPDESFRGAGFIVINQAELQAVLTGLRLPEGAVATIRDTEGLVLARTIEPEKWVGKKLPETQIFQALYGKTDKGILRLRGIDGVERIYAYGFVGYDMERGGLYITIGVPVEKVFEPVRKHTLSVILITIGVIGFAELVAILFANRFIIAPMRELKRVTQIFSENFETRVRPSSSWPSEFIELALAFEVMEDKVVEHQNDLKLLIEQIPGVLYRATMDLSYIFVSSRIQDLVGPEVPIEKPFRWFDFIHEEDRLRVREELNRFVVGEGMVFRSEYRVISKWGVVRWVRDEAVKISLRNGYIIQGIWRDISWRVKSEEEVSLLRSAIEEIPDGFALIGEGGNCLWANMAFLRMLNCSDLTSCGSLKELITPLICLDNQGISFLRALEEGKPWNGRIRVIPNSSRREHVWDVTFFTLTGRISRSSKLFLIRDVTDEFHLQTQLFVSQKMEALGTLATGIAHDFNNILMIILGYAELAIMKLSKGEMDVEKARSFMEEVFLAGQRAKRLVEQILSFARTSPRERMPVSLSVLVKENIKFIQHLIPAEIELISNIEIASGENDTVTASPMEFQQLMINLIINAVQAMEKQGGVITISLKKCNIDEDQAKQLGLPPSENGYLKFLVKDTGCGIDPSIIHRIFDPYFTTKPPGKGTGMGLAIVYNVVKNMNGIIQVESEPGRGSVFRMIFPLCRSETPVRELEDRDLTESGDGLPLSYKRPTRILIVDNEEAILKVLKLELEEKGFYVTAFSDPKRALKVFYEAPFQFDAAIIDYRMSNMNGIELSKQIFNMRPDFPVIILTGFPDEHVELEAKTLGIRGVLGKPASIGEILSILKSCEETKVHETPSQDLL